MHKATILHQENTVLRHTNRDYLTALAKKDRQLQSQQTHIRCLEEQLRLLRHKQYGASSEKDTAGQAELFNEAESLTQNETDITGDDPSTLVAAHTRKPRRPRIPEHLPREQVIHDLPDDEKVCPRDGTALVHIDNERSEQLELIPAQVKVLEHIRRKYACPCCKQYVVTANKPPQPIEKSIATPSLLAYLIISKYADALPLYRQAVMFKRMGIELDRTTLAIWMIKCGGLIQPLINRLLEQAREQGVLHIDETPLQVLNEPGKAPQSKSVMWVLATLAAAINPVVVYRYTQDRGGQHAVDLLDDFSGAIMTDGYSGYSPLESSVTRLGCWAHARRKFVDAKKIQPKGKTGKADQALAWINTLYRIERECKDLPADQRHAIRQIQAKPIMDKLHIWLIKNQNTLPPETAIGKAITYLANQWEKLVRYLDDGDYPIDNNRAENSIRPFVIGRKNWLFSNSQAGARASANLYSIVETAKANGKEPFAYLKHILIELPKALTLEDIDKLLPWNVNL